MQSDAACNRIEWLLNNRLKKISINEQLESLYVDLPDNSYWLPLTYPDFHKNGEFVVDDVNCIFQ